MKECHDYSELDLSPFENPADWNTYSRQISGCLVKTEPEFGPFGNNRTTQSTVFVSKSLKVYKVKQQQSEF